MSTCASCHSDNRDGAKNCRICGKPLSSGGARMCPSGRHPMDPSWSECPYCRNAGSSSGSAGSNRGQTLLEAPGAGASGNRRTMLEAPPSPGFQGPPPALPPGSSKRRGATKFMPEGNQEEPGAIRPVAPTRKMVALLVTYSWREGGQVFPVFEGRNLIGSSEDCEICMGSDPQISGKHATIIFRAGVFLLDDATSMNGTFLEEVDVLEKVRLKNYCNIRTAATNWRFIIIDPAGLAVHEELPNQG